jgi:hypothetical protein
MLLRLYFRCGCEALLPESKTGGEPPRCSAHHAGIARVVTRPPSIVGTATGPHVTTQAMDPAYPTLRQEGHGPLVLKGPETHGG